MVRLVGFELTNLLFGSWVIAEVAYTCNMASIFFVLDVHVQERI